MLDDRNTNSTLYADGNVSISRTMAKFGTTSYPIANIGSVSVNQTGSGRSPVGGFVLGAIAVLGLFAHWIIFVGFGLWALFVAFVDSRQYTLMLKTSSGDVQALQTREEAKVMDAKNAIERAFDLRQ